MFTCLLTGAYKKITTGTFCFLFAAVKISDDRTTHLTDLLNIQIKPVVSGKEKTFLISASGIEYNYTFYMI